MPSFNFHVGRPQIDFVALVFCGGRFSNRVGPGVYGFTIVQVKNTGSGKGPRVCGIFQLVPDKNQVPNIDRKGCECEQHEEAEGDQHHRYPMLVLHRVTED